MHLRLGSRTGWLADSNHASRLRLTVRHGHHSLPPRVHQEPRCLAHERADFIIAVYRFPSVRLPRMKRPSVLALPTEPLRGLAYHPTVPLCAFTYWLWLALAVRHTEQARYGCRIFRDALPGPCGGVEPPSSGISVMLTRDMEPGVGLEPTARCLQRNCSDH